MSLYKSYYNKKLSSKPYKTETEHLRDLLALAEMGLTHLCTVRALSQKESTSEQANELSDKALQMREWLPPEIRAGVYFSVGESVRELSEYVEKTDKPPEAYRGSDIQVDLKQAESHILSRLAFTHKKGHAFPIIRIFDNLKLTKAEKSFFLLALAPCIEARYESLFEYLQGTGKTHPTLRLAFSFSLLFGEISKEEKKQLTDLGGSFFEYLGVPDSIVPASPMARVYSLSRNVYRYICGIRGIAPEFSAICEQFFVSDNLPDMLVRKDFGDVSAGFIRKRGSHPEDEKSNDNTGRSCRMFHIYGEYGNGKRLIARHGAASKGYNLIVVDTAPLVDSKAPELDLLFREIKTEAMLSDSLIAFVENKYYPDDMQTGRAHPPAMLDYLMRKIIQDLDFCFWISREKATYLTQYNIHFMSMEVPLLTASERTVLWEAFSKHYTLSREIDLTLCANQYILSAKGIKETLITAQMLCSSHGRSEITRFDMTEAIRQQSVSQLGQYATLINAVFTWDDLVIDQEPLMQMKMICDQMRYGSIVGEKWGFHKKTPYGRGICAMFYGPPGTGKTMAVQVMANELGLDLYRIDLSQMISKYVGETQKNISDLFQRAKNINAMLFFDEADSMFSKRSEVKDSNDRFANAETAHLLQKLEEYSGITILATNLVSNIDDAFKRRIKFMVNLAFPTATVRLELWKTILPDETRLDEDIDFRFFADSFELSGSSIKEVLTSAAYVAAANGRGLLNEDIILAIKLNFGKYGKVLTQEDFGYLGA